MAVWGLRLSPAGLEAASEVRNVCVSVFVGGRRFQTLGSLWFEFAGQVCSLRSPPPLPGPPSTEAVAVRHPPC